jgi:hypothetical protein
MEIGGELQHDFFGWFTVTILHNFRNYLDINTVHRQHQMAAVTQMDLGMEKARLTL